MYYDGDWHSVGRQEAASRAILRTIRDVEEGLGMGFPRGSTPSESRDIMVESLRSENLSKKTSIKIIPLEK